MENQITKTNNLYYIYDIYGIEPPIGPFNLEQCNVELSKKGIGWGIMDHDTIKSIYTYLDDDQI